MDNLESLSKEETTPEDRVLFLSMFQRVKFLAVLDTMWGNIGKAVPWFPISSENHTGKRLYKLTGTKFPEVWVTNACPQQTNHATKHGKPDTNWLYDNLRSLTGAVKTLPLLVCGGVAQKTYVKCKYVHQGLVHYLPHPAARTWTKSLIQTTAELIQRC